MKWNEEDLKTWRAEKTIVRCESRYENWVRGMVEDWSERWIMVRAISGDILADGYSVIRRVSLKSIEPHGSRQFMEDALELRGQVWPTLSGESKIDLRKAATIVTSALATFPLVAIYQERIDPDTWNVGCEAVVNDGEVCWRDITPHAELKEERLCYYLNDVTRIDFGSLYEDALWQVYSHRHKRRIRTMEQ